MAEGYVDATRVLENYVYNYVYQYKDHLGNVRMNYAADPTQRALKIKEENHYYPFGLKHANYNVEYLEFQEQNAGLRLMARPPFEEPEETYPKFPYNYKYLGQERQDELGLNWDTFRYRNYDYAIGRFFGIDPIAEEF